jgi:hypothetical protein
MKSSFCGSDQLKKLFSFADRSGKHVMRIFPAASVLFISILLITAPCHAKNIYMWTDEHGIPHISDQAPPKGVAAKVLPGERDAPQAWVEETTVQEKAVPQPLDLGLRRKDQPEQSDPGRTANAGADHRKAPQARDRETLSSDEKMRLLVLEAGKERARQLLEAASGEDERLHWKNEIEKFKAGEQVILAPGNR